MALQDKLFSNEVIQDNTNAHSSDTWNRAYLISKDIAEDFNTYKNFGIFPGNGDLAYDSNYKYNAENEKKKIKPKETAGAPSVRSLFNVYAGVPTGNSREIMGLKRAGVNKQKETWTKLVAGPGTKNTQFRYTMNTPLMDTPEIRKELNENMDCSVKKLVQASKAGVFGTNPYKYADFMYCKYLGRVPNNYLITLRRMPTPVSDGLMPMGKGSTRRNEGINGRPPAAMGMMLTWLGVSGNDMKSILSYSYNMPFEEFQAGWTNVEKMGGDNGVLNGMEAALNPKTRQAYESGQDVPALSQFMGKFFNLSQGGPYKLETDFWDEAQKVWGPIDRVKSIYGRSAKGLSWDMKFSLVFEYELRAYNGINPRQAMLDLISNILTVTYTNGGFWGGGYRSSGVQQSSAFQNLNIFKAHGSFTEYMDAFVKDLQSGMTTVKNWLSNNPVQATKDAINMLGGMLVGGLLNNLGRPARYRYPALLSDTPVGVWHITIGNPFRPIVSMGNMILKNTKIEHDGPLGLDDFPTNLKVTCEFDRGRPRDAWQTENIYLKGNARITQPMASRVYDMYASADKYKNDKDTGESVIDTAAQAVENIKSKAYERKFNDANTSVPEKAKQDIDKNKQTITPDTAEAEALNNAIYKINLPDENKTSTIMTDVFGVVDNTAIMYASREQYNGAFPPSKQEPKAANDNKSDGKPDASKQDTKTKSK